MSEEAVEQGRHESSPSAPVRWRDRPRVALWSWGAGRELLFPPLIAVMGGWFAVTNSFGLLTGKAEPSDWPLWGEILWTLVWAVLAIAAARLSWLWLKRPVGSVSGSSLPRLGQGAFTTATKGYVPSEVDRFLATNPSSAVIRAVQFSTARPGYDMDEVDAELDRLGRDGS
jgi:DivIVA domain-containing protein